MDAQEKRIEQILGRNCDKTMATALAYKKHLVASLKTPCLVTGVEDFPWEERYLLGGGSEKEYRKLKKKYPSYTDKYELLEIVDPDDEEYELTARFSAFPIKKYLKSACRGWRQWIEKMVTTNCFMIIQCGISIIDII